MAKKSASPGYSEADLAKYFQSKMRSLCIVGWRMPLGGVLRSIKGKLVHTPNMLRGYPDWAGLCAGPGQVGRLWACELKLPRGHISIDQHAWHKALSDAGAIVRVCRTFAEIDAFLISVSGEIYSKAGG